ncbi:hypothetical protein AB0K60_32980 [Thermopolyspora sp. NPDC052614]|uniref:hypothetical protein n=1 Tax=Thermopolyspora sp. NPDC052614 TaxID=3155682 RepID=UPI0034328AFF
MHDPYPEVVRGHTDGSIYVESPGIDRCVLMYDELRKLSLDQQESVDLVSAIAEEFR